MQADKLNTIFMIAFSVPIKIWQITHILPSLLIILLTQWWLMFILKINTFFYKQQFFFTAPRCCFIISWIELQMLIRCCLIQHFIYLLCLSPCIYLGLFMLNLLCDLFFIFISIFIMINLIISWKQTYLFFCLLFRICPIIFGW